jgi:hypothetical protein
MNALSYIYVVVGAAFIVSAALVVTIGARTDRAPRETIEEHDRTPASLRVAENVAEYGARCRSGRLA